jgi:hypothetical protein
LKKLCHLKNRFNNTCAPRNPSQACLRMSPYMKAAWYRLVGRPARVTVVRGNPAQHSSTAPHNDASPTHTHTIPNTLVQLIRSASLIYHTTRAPTIESAKITPAAALYTITSQSKGCVCKRIRSLLASSASDDARLTLEFRFGCALISGEQSLT